MVIAAGLCGGLAASLMSFAQPTARAQADATPQAMSVRELVLLGADGKPRAKLSVGQAGAELRLRDAQGKDRLVVASADDGASGLTMLDAAGRTRFRIAMLADGSAGLEMLKADGKPRYTFGSEPEGEAGLSMYGPDGVERFSIGAGVEGNGGLAVNYPSGEECIGIGVGKGGAGIWIRTPDGKSLLGIHRPPDGTAEIIMNDLNGEEMLRLP
jgi:hypothetical protein